MQSGMTLRSCPSKRIGRLISAKQRASSSIRRCHRICAAMVDLRSDGFDWNAIATLAVWIMTLFIQRTNRRDPPALHAKLDEQFRVDQPARSDLVLRTVRSLAIVAEVVHGAPYRFRDRRAIDCVGEDPD